jgi:tripartite-type tricarboxylate transporter receptor subunit TctC
MAKKISFWVMIFVLIPVFSSFASEPFPSRQIEIIVPWVPGGGSDLMARTLAPKMSEILGQPVVVLNKPGGGGTVGLTYLATRKPDGHSLIMVTPTPFILVPQLQKVEYTAWDFTYITGLVTQLQGVQVRADAPWRTFRDLLDDAKKNPGKIKYGTYGVASIPHILMEGIAKDRGITWTHVPFKGDSDLITAVLGGHVMVTTATTWVPHAQAGRVRELVLFTEKRCSDFPDVPILKELGFDYYCGASSLNGIAGPKGLPEEILKKLEDAIRVAAESPEFIKGAKVVAHEIHFQNSKDFTKSMEEGFNKLGDMLKSMGLKQ